MTAYVPPYSPSLTDWQRQVSLAVNPVFQKLQDTVDVKADFGADLTGSADSTLAFNNAFATGKIVYAPAGTYLISGPLIVTLSYSGLVGDGYATKIITNNATADIFQLGDGSNEIRGLFFRNFRVWSSVTKTAGYVFNAAFITYATFENVGIGTIADYSDSGSAHKLYKGYRFNGFMQCVVSGGEIVTSSDCVTINGKASGTWGAELSFDGGLRLYGSNGKGFYLGGGAGGVHLQRLDASLCRYGVYCDNLLISDANRELFIHSGCTLDSDTGSALNVEASGLALLEAPGAWFSGTGQPTSESAIVFKSGAGTTARFTASRVYGNYGHGVEINDSTGYYNFTGCFINLNGRGTGGGHGIKVAASAKLLMNSNIITANGNATVGYGISLAGTVNNYVAMANDLSGNGQGAIDMGGAVTGATRIVQNNLT